MNIITSNGVTISNGVLKVDGEVVEFPKKLNGNISNSIIGNSIYINGYEYIRKTKTFKRTLRAMYHYIF